MALDTTELKTQMGGNAITAMSFCFADVASKMINKQMFEYIREHIITIKKKDLADIVNKEAVMRGMASQPFQNFRGGRAFVVKRHSTRLDNSSVSHVIGRPRSGP
jgi:hypothetical protein